MFLIRSHSIDILGSDLVGYWQSAQTISGIYISIIATIIATYFYPKFSSSIRGKPKFFIIRELLKSLLFSLIICFLFCSFLFTFKKSIFSIAFSNEFTAVSNFIGYQILGDLFRVIIVNVSYFLLARGEQLKFISIEIISAVSYTILVYFTVHSGIVDIFYSYIMSGIITLFSASIIMVFHCRREIKCRH
jgi:O-antigen/teichoic acid export membrane protein